MSIIKALSGLFGRGNPHRAFGDGVYLADHWSDGSASRSKVTALLERLKRLSVYQMNFDAGSMEPDGTLHFPRGAESFVWETDAWSQAGRYPVKCVAWVRNLHHGRRVSLSSQGVARNLLYCLGFFRAFKGFMLDLQFDTLEEQNAFFEILREVSTGFADKSVGVRAHFSWLDKPELVRQLLKQAQDVELPLQDSGQSRGTYSTWCAELTSRAMRAMGPEHLVLGVPALSKDGRPAESLESALNGIRRGLKQGTSQRVRVNLYREGQASEEEWKVFAREWAH